MKLKARGVNLEKVIKIIDDMVTLLGKEQVDDDVKKEYVTSEIDKSEDEIKELDHVVDGLEKVNKVTKTLKEQDVKCKKITQEKADHTRFCDIKLSTNKQTRDSTWKSRMNSPRSLKRRSMV